MTEPHPEYEHIPPTKTVDTDDFWNLMCNPRFNRLSSHHGRIGNQVYRVLVPPESVDGFMEGKLKGALDDLGLTGRRRFRDIVIQASVTAAVLSIILLPWVAFLFWAFS